MFTRFSRARALAPRVLLAGLVALGASACAPTDVVQAPTAPTPARRNLNPSGSGVVISQVYGGGGNTGATYKNDFIELYNNSNGNVSLAGWSVQYASTGGTSWQKTDLPAVTLQPGQFFLIHESANGGGTLALTPDVTGPILMAAGAGKVALVRSATLIPSGSSCPSAAIVEDFVGYGSGTNCVMTLTGPAAPASPYAATATLTNTTAAIRKGSGTTDSNNNSADFTTGAANPRNTASPFVTPVPGVIGANGPQVSVQLSPASVGIGGTSTATASVTVSGSPVTPTSITWSSGNGNATIVDATVNPATITGQIAGSATITASVVVNGQTYTGGASLAIAGMNLSGRSSYLPVGFQTQLFVSGNSQTGVAQNNQSVTWSSSNAAAVTVDANGVITAVGPGSAQVIATAADGTRASTPISTQVAPTNAGARDGFNTALGLPTDNDPSDDVIIQRKQYTLSYNPRRNVSNWSAWNLDASHQAPAGTTVARCNCFTLDTALTRLGLPGTTTNDWINNGEYSRGHLSPSADWLAADGDNAATFFLTNMLPQTQAMNAGPWGDLENYLRSQITPNNEIYIIAGGIWTKDRLGPGIDGFGRLNGNRIAIPDSMWKIAVIVPDQRTASAITAADVRVIAVNMPNTATVPSATWTDYQTTVDRLQRSTGYDFLSMIPAAVQCVLESRTCGPTAAIRGPTSAVANAPVTFDGSSSVNNSSNPLSYAWDFGNGVTSTNVTPTVSFAAGTYTVSLTVSDGVNSSTATKTLVVTGAPMTANIATTFPGWTPGQSVTLAVGQSLTMVGSATDPAGRPSYRLNWNYGDGTGFALTSSAIPTTTRPMSRTKAWSTPGTYTVTFTVQNSVGGSATATLSVIVQ